MMVQCYMHASENICTSPVPVYISGYLQDIVGSISSPLFSFLFLNVREARTLGIGHSILKLMAALCPNMRR